MNSKFLVLLHEHSTPAGTTLEWLQQRQFPFDLVLASEVDFTSLSLDYRGTIICGGGMNVDEEQKYPWLKEEKNYITELIKKKKKIVGLCLGAQLIAENLGAEVKTEKKWEVGWHDVEILNQDFLFKSSQQNAVDPSTRKIKAFHLHQYFFKLPVGADLLATNSFCKNQAYTFESHILAFQFHPEVDRAWIEKNLHVIKNDWSGLVQDANTIQTKWNYLHGLKEWYFCALSQFFKNELI